VRPDQNNSLMEMNKTIDNLGTKVPEARNIADIINRNQKRTKELSLKQMNLASNAQTHKIGAQLSYTTDLGLETKTAPNKAGEEEHSLSSEHQ
jgi:hypothetical protein